MKSCGSNTSKEYFTSNYTFLSNCSAFVKEKCSFVVPKETELAGMETCNKEMTKIKNETEGKKYQGTESKIIKQAGAEAVHISTQLKLAAPQLDADSSHYTPLCIINLLQLKNTGLATLPALPKEIEMATIGPQKDLWGVERGLSLGFWVL